MKILFGYGKCAISNIYNTNDLIAFNVDHNSFTTIQEIASEWTDIQKNNNKYIYGYHLNFELSIKAQNVGSGEQDDIFRFLYYYYSQTTDNNIFRLFPIYDSGIDNYIDYSGFPVFLNDVTISNITEKTRANGQMLRLYAKTTSLIGKNDFKNYLLYRNTTDDAFGLFNSQNMKSGGGKGEGKAEGTYGFLYGSYGVAANPQLGDYTQYGQRA